MIDPMRSLSVPALLRQNAQRQRLREAEAFVQQFEPVPEPTPGPDDGTRRADGKPMRPRAPAAPARVIPAQAEAAPVTPPPAAVPPQPAPEMAQPAPDERLPEAPPVEVPDGKPVLPEGFSDSDIEAFVYDTVDWFGADAFLQLPLDRAHELLEMPGRVDPMDAERWGSMSPQDRARVIDQIAQDPMATFRDAMDAAELGLSPERPSADGSGELWITDPAETEDFPADDALTPEEFDRWQRMTPQQRMDWLNDPANGFAPEPTPAAPPWLLEGEQEARLPAASDTLAGNDGTDTLAAPPKRSWVRRAASDIGTGIGEAATQIVGGVRDAAYAGLSGIAEFDEWASDSLGLPKLQILNESGALDLALLSAEEGQTATVLLPEVRKARSVTGGLIRGVSQFIAGYAAGGKALSSVGWVAGKAKIGRAMAQAAISDFAAFDGHEARLSDLVQEFPALQNPITEYLASDMEDSELEGRLKNVAEGALSDIILSGLVAGVRGIRAARKVKAGNGLAAYRDASKRLATDGRVGANVLPEADKLVLPEAPLLTVARPAPQMSTLGQDRSPRALAREIRAFLNKVGRPEDEVAPLAASLKKLREGGGTKAPRGRPAQRALEGLGGVDPNGPLAAELKTRGITPRTHPRLFRPGGITDADNIPIDDVAIFQGRDLDDGSGYIPPDAWVEALEAETRGAPWADPRAPRDVEGEALDQLAEDLDRMGIAWRDASDQEVFDALELARRDGLTDEAMDAIPDSAPRSEADFERELAEMAEAGNPNVSAIETGGAKVYVNWGRIASEFDVRALIQKMADAAQAEIDEARRGVRSNEQTALSADRENAWELLVERRKGQALNAEQTLALRRLWTASGERLAEVARAVAKAPTPQNSFMFRRAMALHGTIQREIIAVRTETARALQQWSIPAGSNEFIAKQMQDMVTQHGDTEVSVSLARNIAAAAENKQWGQVDYAARNGAGAATFEAVAELWVKGLLTGPKTHVVNAMSNGAVIFLQQAERMTAAQIGALRGTVDPVEIGEAGAMVHGMFSSMREAGRLAAHAFKTGESGFGIGKVELPRARAMSTEMLGNTRSAGFNAIVNTPLISHGINAVGAIYDAFSTRPLVAADEFFKTINFRMDLHAQAFRMSMQEMRAQGLDPAWQRQRMAELIAQPDDAMEAQAREAAQYATFTNDGGDLAKMIIQARNKWPAARFIFPFVNTVANLIRFATERSPAAPLLADVRADFRAGGSRADMAAARMAIGSFGMMLTYDAAMSGLITGAGPTNPAERATLYRMGWQPYSIRIGDRYFAYNRTDPMGAQLAIAANIAEMTLNSELDPGEEYEEAVYRAIGATGKMLLDKTYFTGLSDLINAASDPTRYTPGYIENLLGSFVPAGVREVEAFVDPELRAASNTLDNIRSRIPGLSADLPARRDLWGRPIAFQSGLGAVYDALSPIYSKKLSPEPIDEEFVRIGVFPGMPSMNMTVDRETFSLRNSPEVYQRYVELQGGTPASAIWREKTNTRGPTTTSKRMQAHGDKTLKDALNGLLDGTHPRAADYAEGDVRAKTSIIEQTIEDYREFAKDRLLEEFPETFASGTGRTRGGAASPFALSVGVQ